MQNKVIFMFYLILINYMFSNLEVMRMCKSNLFLIMHSYNKIK